MAYDIIGDVHGCHEECLALLRKLGYVQKAGWPVHADGRVPVFLGDITDRGPDSVAMIRLVTGLVERALAHYVPGNHCDKLYRYLIGRPVQIKNGLETTVAELSALARDERQRITSAFLRLYERAPLYLVLAKGELVVAHAGIRASDIGQMNRRIKSFVLYGDTTGETDEKGFPIRRDWAKHYEGHAWIVYGHTPVRKPRWYGKTVNIDTGCVFGGHLTAFRWPEKETVSVPSRQPFFPEKFHAFESNP